MKKYEGRKWGTLTKAEQAELLRFANAIDAINCENANGTCDCIIDLTAFESRYIVDEVYKVPDEIVKSEMLQYPNRLKAHLVKACGEYKENVIKYHSNIDLTIIDLTIEL